MGAWGYGPFDNDSALDWLDEIEGPIIRTIDQTLSKSRGRDDYMYQLAAASLLAQLSRRKGELPLNLSYRAGKVDLFDKAIAAVASAQQNGDAIKAWDKPEVFLAELVKLKAQLVAIKREEAKHQKRVAARIVRRHKRKVSKPRKAGGPQ